MYFRLSMRVKYTLLAQKKMLKAFGVLHLLMLQSIIKMVNGVNAMIYVLVQEKNVISLSFLSMIQKN